MAVLTANCKNTLKLSDPTKHNANQKSTRLQRLKPN
jgi:hypothetical protein